MEKSRIILDALRCMFCDCRESIFTWAMKDFFRAYFKEALKTCPGNVFFTKKCAVSRSFVELTYIFRRKNSEYKNKSRISGFPHTLPSQILATGVKGE